MHKQPWQEQVINKQATGYQLDVRVVDIDLVQLDVHLARCSVVEHGTPPARLLDGVRGGRLWVENVCHGEQLNNPPCAMGLALGVSRGLK